MQKVKAKGRLTNGLEKQTGREVSRVEMSLESQIWGLNSENPRQPKELLFSSKRIYS